MRGIELNPNIIETSIMYCTKAVHSQRFKIEREAVTKIFIVCCWVGGGVERDSEDCGFEIIRRYEELEVFNEVSVWLAMNSVHTKCF